MTMILRMRPVLALMLLLSAISGCGVATRSILSSPRQLVATPADRGLAYEELHFPSRDGVMLYGWYLPGRAKMPLILYCQGNAGNISQHLDKLIALHELGFPVFIFDYRGFGASSGRAEHEEDLLADALGALDLLNTRGWTPERMIYYGQSLGAAVALNLAVGRPAAGVVLECSFTSLRELAWHKTPWTYALFGWWSLDSSFDNLGRIGHLQSPLLMLHGDSDHIAPLSMAERIYARAPQPKTLVVIPGADHSDCGSVDAPLYGRSWTDFVSSLSIPLRKLAGENDAP
ncbi:MAG: hypothetical protein A2005_09450 [Desulfuromonadales bacterium GWC2_61_20]|nr:MAG: hypothetical protein A2005_09450 [Desulfuromonadales bacterium GWC2_61_20]HAD05310.1 hypothetical protein [Desulfuromonas sp.]